MICRMIVGAAALWTAAAFAPSASAQIGPPKEMSPGHAWATDAASLHARCRPIMGAQMPRSGRRRGALLDSAAMQRQHTACVDRALKRAITPAPAATPR